MVGNYVKPLSLSFFRSLVLSSGIDEESQNYSTSLALGPAFTGVVSVSTTGHDEYKVDGDSQQCDLVRLDILCSLVMLTIHDYAGASRSIEQAMSITAP